MRQSLEIKTAMKLLALLANSYPFHFEQKWEDVRVYLATSIT